MILPGRWGPCPVSLVTGRAVSTHLLFAASPLPAMPSPIICRHHRLPRSGPSPHGTELFSLVSSPEASSWSLPFFLHLGYPGPAPGTPPCHPGSRDCRLCSSEAWARRDLLVCAAGSALISIQVLELFRRTVKSSSSFRASPPTAVTVYESCCRARSASQSSRIGGSCPFYHDCWHLFT